MFKKCRLCTHSGRDCLPYLLSLSTDDLLDWCRERKADLHISNAQLADETNTPRGTVDRLLAHGNTDFRYSTMQPVVLYLAGLKPEDMNCEAIQESNSEQAEETVAAWKDRALREQSIARQRIHIIRILSVALAVLMAVIIIALATDLIDPEIGFFWHLPHNN